MGPLDLVVEAPGRLPPAKVVFLQRNPGRCRQHGECGFLRRPAGGPVQSGPLCCHAQQRRYLPWRRQRRRRGRPGRRLAHRRVSERSLRSVAAGRHRRACGAGRFAVTRPFDGDVFRRRGLAPVHGGGRRGRCRWWPTRRGPPHGWRSPPAAAGATICPAEADDDVSRQDGQSVYLAGCATGTATVELRRPSDGTVLNTYTLEVTGSPADLVVESTSVSDSTLTPGQSFTLRATVRNQGTGQSAATTLRYYRSSNRTISRRIRKSAPMR